MPALPAAEGQREGTEGSAIAGAGVDPLAAIARSRRRRSTASKSAGLGEQWGIVCGVSKLRLGYVMSDVVLDVDANLTWRGPVATSCLAQIST